MWGRNQQHAVALLQEVCDKIFLFRFSRVCYFAMINAIVMFAKY